MILVRNAIADIAKIYVDGSFNLDKWKEYIAALNLDEDIFIDDMNETINSGSYTFAADYLPVLNDVYNSSRISETVNSFKLVTDDLQRKVIEKFNRSPNVQICLYLGLCNGAGWAIKIDDRQYILLGIEKIIELGWCDVNSMNGLIYHELGHIYHMQYGLLNREYEAADKYLWTLFCEGVAMYFEQLLLENTNYFHQDDKDAWLLWCDQNMAEIKNDFNDDLKNMNDTNQRYFGDWVEYRGRKDVGYYLGARFVQLMASRYTFDEMINFDIENVKSEWKNFNK